MLCTLCKSNDATSAPGRPAGLCAECAVDGAIVALPPSTRPARPCRVCDGRSFVRVVPREFSSTTERGDYAVPMYAVHGPRTRKNVFGSGSTTYAPDPRGGGLGLLEMFICRGCQAVEWYCHGAAELPIHPAYNTELVEYPADGAYR